MLSVCRKSWYPKDEKSHSVQLLAASEQVLQFGLQYAQVVAVSAH